MSSIIEKITLLASELTNSEHVQVLCFHLFPAADDHLLRDIEQKIGFPLDDTLRELYQHSNGIQLIWINKDNEAYQSSHPLQFKEPLSWEFTRDDYQPFDGAIFILPIQEVFLKNWKNVIWFDEEIHYQTSFRGQPMSVLEFKQRIKPFDLFDKYYCCAIITDDNSLKIVLGQDHESDFQSSKICSVGEYLETLILTKGNIAERVKIMKDEWGALN